VRYKAAHKNVQDPLARTRVGLDARRVEDLGGEVAAEDAPRGAVGGRADVVLVAGDDLTDGEGWGAVGEYGAVLDEGFVGEATVGHEDGRARADVEGDYGPVGGVEVADDWLELGEGPAEPLDSAEDGNDEGSRRELLGFLGEDQTVEQD
jgi:hypothetical protein